MQTISSAVDLADVRKAFRRGKSVTEVLRGVDLCIERGECVVLAGPSGSGKTTLLSILGCTLKADQGSVRILGQDVARLNSKLLAGLRRDRIGFLFQRFHLIRGLSAVENVAVPLILAGASERNAKRKAKERLHAVGLAEHVGSDPRKMSVGQCQRVALARAVVNEPELVLADEPTASLDAESGAAAMQLIRDLAKQERRASVVVTHDQRVFQFADRVLQLEAGRISQPTDHDKDRTSIPVSRDTSPQDDPISDLRDECSMSGEWIQHPPLTTV